MRALAGIVLLMLANGGLGNFVIGSVIVLARPELVESSKLVITILASPFMGALFLFCAMKVWRGWRTALGILWTLLGFGGLSEGVRIIEHNLAPIGPGVLLWGLLSLMIGAIVFFVDRPGRFNRGGELD